MGLVQKLLSRVRLGVRILQALEIIQCKANTHSTQVASLEMAGPKWKEGGYGL